MVDFGTAQLGSGMHSPLHGGVSIQFLLATQFEVPLNVTMVPWVGNKTPHPLGFLTLFRSKLQTKKWMTCSSGAWHHELSLANMSLVFLHVCFRQGSPRDVFSYRHLEDVVSGSLLHGYISNLRHFYIISMSSLWVVTISDARVRVFSNLRVPLLWNYLARPSLPCKWNNISCPAPCIGSHGSYYLSCYLNLLIVTLSKNLIKFENIYSIYCK